MKNPPHAAGIRRKQTRASTTNTKDDYEEPFERGEKKAVSFTVYGICRQ
jgi:hypothetical protein